MPWRDDYRRVFWMDPNPPRLRGVPRAERQAAPRASSDSKRELRRRVAEYLKDVTGPSGPGDYIDDAITALLRDCRSAMRAIDQLTLYERKWGTEPTKNFLVYLVDVYRNPMLYAVRVELRDRVGFRYYRDVALGDSLSVQEAAKALGVSIVTILNWVKRGELPSRKKRIKSKRGAGNSDAGYTTVRLRDVLQLAFNKRKTIRFHKTTRIADKTGREHIIPTGRLLEHVATDKAGTR